MCQPKNTPKKKCINSQILVHIIVTHQIQNTDNKAPYSFIHSYKNGSTLINIHITPYENGSYKGEK